MKKIKLKKFFVFFSAYFVFSLLLIITLNFIDVYVYRNVGFDGLLNYQIKKITQDKNIGIAFIGDSSLGNAIDYRIVQSRLKTRALNVALTGRYGYLGTYNMLKRVYDNNPETLKIVVIMHSLDAMTRDVSYDGFFYTLAGFPSHREINVLGFESFQEITYRLTDIFSIPGALINFINNQSYSTQNIKNDYISQGLPKDYEKYSQERFEKDDINMEKLESISLIDSFCKKKGLICIYSHGPYHQNVTLNSQQYLNEVNRALKNHFDLVIDPYYITSESLGDSIDHIRPDKKEKSTLFYLDIISNFLRSHPEQPL